MSKLSTRPATLQDVEAVAPLFDAYRQFYEQEADVALARRFIHDRIARSESVVLVAENELGEVLGFCQMYPGFCSVEAAPIYTLYDLFVKPAARKSGTGRALLLGAEMHARRQGVVRLDLTTARTNLPAQSLYESLGWVRDEIFLAYNKLVAR